MDGHEIEFKEVEIDGGKRGIILVEIIVVMVVVALTAAILLPKIYGTVQLAKENAEITETQTVTLALQAVLTMTYGKANIGDKGDHLSFADLTYFDKDDISNIKLTERAYKEMSELAGVGFGDVENIVLENKITLKSFRYYTRSGSTVDYHNGEYFVVELY